MGRLCGFPPLRSSAPVTIPNRHSADLSVNSFAFLLLFLPATLALVAFARTRLGEGAAKVVLLGASLLFYSFAGLPSLALLLTSVTVNWLVVRSLSQRDANPAFRKRLFLLALTANVGTLCVFKYAAAVSVLVRSEFGWPARVPELGFPLGLSFYTLTQVMYLVNCYEGIFRPLRWIDLMSFVSFFPNVTAGPLLKAKLFFSEIPRIGERVRANERVTFAAILICLGLAKKVVLGDSFARLASAGYASVGGLSTLEAWVFSLAGTFEIYFDFSGYSDIAFGSAVLLGLTLTRNFNVPFRAASISEFWQRWHISLSEFITTYLYTPVLRSMGRATLGKSAFATIIAMLIAGVWHGASWSFVLFGLLHGVALALFQVWKRKKRPMPKPLAVLVTFAFVNAAFVTVRAGSLPDALEMLVHLLPQSKDWKSVV